MFWLFAQRVHYSQYLAYHSRHRVSEFPIQWQWALLHATAASSQASTCDRVHLVSIKFQVHLSQSRCLRATKSQPVCCCELSARCVVRPIPSRADELINSMIYLHITYMTRGGLAGGRLCMWKSSFECDFASNVIRVHLPAGV